MNDNDLCKEVKGDVNMDLYCNHLFDCFSFVFPMVSCWLAVFACLAFTWRHGKCPQKGLCSTTPSDNILDNTQRMIKSTFYWVQTHRFLRHYHHGQP